MKVEVVFALARAVECVVVDVPAGARLIDAVRASGVLGRHALAEPAYGIFGRRASPEEVLAECDRVEVYRPLAMDPNEARRRRAGKKLGG